MTAYEKIKKYLFLLSILFVALISAHSILVYLYHDSVTAPEEGGSINVGLVGGAALPNPAEYSKRSEMDFILQFLYRSIIKYNTATKKLEGDLANCDLSNNYATIKCTLRADSLWKDGSRVTRDDIFATYNLLKNTDINPGLKQLLSNVDIIERGDTLIFSAKSADALVLDALMIPIMKSKDAEAAQTGKFDPKTALTSGAYEYVSTEIDSQTKVKRIAIQKSQKLAHDNVYIGKYNFKFFPDKKTLLRYEDSLGIIYTPTDTAEAPRSPRLNAYRFLLPQHVSLFLNTERLKPEIRKLITFYLDSIKYPNLNLADKKAIANPFFTDEKITPDVKNSNISTALKALGYYKKDELAAVLNQKLDTAIKAQAASDFGYNFYFKTPTTKQAYFTDRKEILISGNVAAGVTGVSINDYRLKSFVPGNTKFYFKANTDLKTLKDGANTYTLYFDIAGKKIRKETLTVYRSDDKNWLVDKEKELKGAATAKAAKSPSMTNLQGEKEKTAKKIAALDSALFYDINFAPFSLTVAYSNQPDTTDLGGTIARELKTLGIQIEEKPVTSADIQNMITKGEKNYDILVTGINLGLFEYNIAPFFHSGQAKTGFNFSKLKNGSLDVLLEEIKSRQLDNDRLRAVKTQILDILKKEAVIKTYYSPYNVVYIDRNLKKTEFVDNIPYAHCVYDTIQGAYIKESRTMILKNKSIFDFIQWIIKLTF